jgi:hypothetical protein
MPQRKPNPRVELHVAGKRGKMCGKMCLACIHPERHLIDDGIAKHASRTGMAQRFGISIHVLDRHRRRHIPAAVVAQALAPIAEKWTGQHLDELRTVESERLLSNAVLVRRKLYHLAESAENSCNYAGATAAYGRILQSLELIGKLLNQFTTHAHVTHSALLVSPDYLRLRSALLTALLPFPEARAAVAKVLRELETVDAEVEVNGQSQPARD